MYRTFFKIIRRVGSILHTSSLAFKHSYYYQLSGRRHSLHRSLSAGRGLSVQSDLTETFIVTGANLRVRDNFHIMMGTGGRLTIGDNCFFNNNCSINCLKTIAIGNDCQFGENVVMYDHNHRYKSTEQLIAAQGYDTGAISIGNNCWIGSNVVILKGVVIGDNVVIGAGCVIYESVATNMVVINQQNLAFKNFNP